MPNHTVQQGECLFRIAAQYGFRNFRTVYDDAGNAKLRKLRPNPSLLFPGDVVFIPEKKPKEAPAPTNKLHRFRVAAAPRELRLVLLDLDGNKLVSEPYELDIEGVTTSGVTGADGLIVRKVAPNAENGLLTTKRFVWPLNLAHLNPVEHTSDDGVSGFQARLRNLGYDPGPIDGIAGPLTAQAVTEFQADTPPLKVDGVCGAQTRAKLLELYGC